jgi:hypothetical protein
VFSFEKAKYFFDPRLYLESYAAFCLSGIPWQCAPAAV